MEVIHIKIPSAYRSEEHDPISSEKVNNEHIASALNALPVSIVNLYSFSILEPHIATHARQGSLA